MSRRRWLNTNTIIPAGSVKIGNREYRVELNGSPDEVSKFNHLPIKVVNGTPIFLGDVAPVTDTHQVQTNVVRVDGQSRDLYPDLQACRGLDPERNRSASRT